MNKVSLKSDKKANSEVPSNLRELQKEKVHRLLTERGQLKRTLGELTDRYFKQYDERFLKFLKLSDEDIERPYQNMVDRMMSEAKIFQGIERLLRDDNLISQVAGELLPPNVESDASDKLDSGTAGQYDILENRIRLSEEKPSKQMIWYQLAFEGLYPALETFYHETLHHKFFGDSAQFFLRTWFDRFLTRFHHSMITWLMKVAKSEKYQSFLTTYPEWKKFSDFCAGKAMEMIMPHMQKLCKQRHHLHVLGETLSQKLAGKLVDQNKTTSALTQRLIEYYGFDDLKDIRRIVSISVAINRLRAVGLRDRGIIALFGKAAHRYNEELGSFPLINKFIKQRLKKGVTLDDVDYAAKILQMKDRNDILKCNVIALEELVKITE